VGRLPGSRGDKSVAHPTDRRHSCRRWWRRRRASLPHHPPSRAPMKQLRQVVGGKRKLFLPVGAKTCFGGEAFKRPDNIGQPCRNSHATLAAVGGAVFIESKRAAQLSQVGAALLPPTIARQLLGKSNSESLARSGQAGLGCSLPTEHTPLLLNEDDANRPSGSDGGDHSRAFLKEEEGAGDNPLTPAPVFL